MPRSAATSCLGGQRIASRRTVDRQPRVAEEHSRSDRRVRSLGAGDVLTRPQGVRLRNAPSRLPPPDEAEATVTALPTPRPDTPIGRAVRPHPPVTPKAARRCTATLTCRTDLFRLIACRAGVALTHQTYRRCLDCRGTQFPQRSPGTPCPWGEQGYRGSPFPKLAVRSDVGACITRSAAAPSLRRAATFPEHVPGRHRLAGQFASPNDRRGIDLAQRVLEPLRRDPTDRLEETLDDAAYLWIG